MFAIVKVAIVSSTHSRPIRHLFFTVIIYRYLSSQLLSSTLAVAFVLSIIIFSGRFLGYMAEAASGKIEGWAVFLVLLYRLPEFMTLILPLSLFLGILLSYGRMYIDYEMIVLLEELLNCTNNMLSMMKTWTKETDEIFFKMWDHCDPDEIAIAVNDWHSKNVQEKA